MFLPSRETNFTMMEFPTNTSLKIKGDASRITLESKRMLRWNGDIGIIWRKEKRGGGRERKTRESETWN